MGITVERIGQPVDGASIGKWVQAQTIKVAENALRRFVAKGFDPSPVVVTDGMPRRDYALVKPFGKIEFIANTELAEAVRWALTELQKRSPVLTGRYALTHTVLLNGKEIQGNIWQTLRQAKSTDRVQIVNPQPYARKIEKATANKKTGRGARKALSKQAKAGVYQPVLRALVNRYGRSLFFDFKYVNLNLGVKVWGDQGGRYRKDGSRTYVKRVQRDQIYPCLQFFKKSVGAVN